MAVRTDFAAGEVLAAQDLDDTFASKVNYALPTNPQAGSGASAYTFVLADGLRLTTASNAAAATYTIPPQASVVWLANSVIRVVNYGAGTLTIAGGAGVTLTNSARTLAQFESVALIRTASNAWTLVPFSGAGNANFSDAATGTYTDAGINYKYITFTGSGTLTVTKAGLADVLVVGGGGGCGNGTVEQVGGGGAGGYGYFEQVYLSATTKTVTVGNGGAVGAVGGSSRFDIFYSEGGGNGGLTRAAVGGVGGSGGGGGDLGGTGGRGIVGQGNNGGNGPSNESGGGGGAGGAGGTAGQRGAGVANSITGASFTYSVGGLGGGTGSAGAASGANLGKGGDAGGVPAVAYAGGSGVVIVRVRV